MQNRIQSMLLLLFLAVYLFCGYGAGRRTIFQEREAVYCCYRGSGKLQLQFQKTTFRKQHKELILCIAIQMCNCQKTLRKNFKRNVSFLLNPNRCASGTNREIS
ncbi:hypothetical protein AAHE18_10G198500 [Arachis hypogaea]